MGQFRDRVVHPARRVRGRVVVPGDKSISHRLLLLGALAAGTTRIRGLSTGDDCRSTATCLAALGSTMDRPSADEMSIVGRGTAGFAPPSADLDAGNSGTTARLLMGVLAGHSVVATLTGDESLRRRPMVRVIEPLTRMGATISSADGRLPATVRGGRLTGIDVAPEVPSAQVKSAILLAGLRAEGTTRVIERARTRDHTEIAFRQFGAVVVAEGLTVSVDGGQRLSAVDAVVPGDPSSAAYWAAAAAALPGSHVDIGRVCLNPTRTAFMAVLARMGASTSQTREDDGQGEFWGTLSVRHEDLGHVCLSEEEVPGVIDELPVLAALATHGGGLTVRGAGELRVKESDRIAALVAGLRALGADADEYADGFAVDGSRPLSGGVANAAGDHRLAMAFAIAALGGRAPSTIVGASAVSISYPGFFDQLERLTA